MIEILQSSIGKEIAIWFTDESTTSSQRLVAVDQIGVAYQSLKAGGGESTLCAPWTTVSLVEVV